MHRQIPRCLLACLRASRKPQHPSAAIGGRLTLVGTTGRDARGAAAALCDGGGDRLDLGLREDGGRLGAGAVLELEEGGEGLALEGAAGGGHSWFDLGGGEWCVGEEVSGW